MNTIENTVNKLRLTGANIVGYNSFGIVISDNDDNKIVWILDKNNKLIKYNYESSEIRLNNSFIVVTNKEYEQITALYVKNSDNLMTDLLNIDSTICRMATSYQIFRVTYNLFSQST